MFTTGVDTTTLVPAVAVLLLLSGSGVADATLAVLLMEFWSNVHDTFIVSVISWGVPGANAAMVAETVPWSPGLGAVMVQPPGAVTETKEAPCGMTSVNTTFSATSGPE